MTSQKGYGFVYSAFVRIWLSALLIVFIRAPIEWLGYELSAGFWFKFYSFGGSYLVVSWFFMLARHQNLELKEKYELYRTKKRIKDAEEKAKLLNDPRHRPD